MLKLNFRKKWNFEIDLKWKKLIGKWNIKFKWKFIIKINGFRGKISSIGLIIKNFRRKIISFIIKRIKNWIILIKFDRLAKIIWRKQNNFIKLRKINIRSKIRKWEYVKK